MADSLDDIMTQARTGGIVSVTLVTNQDTGVASYGSANLTYSETRVSGFKGFAFVEQHLSTTADGPLLLHFSEPDAFRANIDRIGFKVSRRAGGFGPVIAEVTFLDFGNRHFTIPLNEMSKCWVGKGPRFDQADTADAVWVFSFQPAPGVH